MMTNKRTKGKISYARKTAGKGKNTYAHLVGKGLIYGVSVHTRVVTHGAKGANACPLHPK